MSKFKAQYKKDSPFSLANITLHNAGQEACDPLHTWSGVRDFYSFHTVVAGKGTYKVADTLFSLQAGDTFLIYPNTLVTYQADGIQPWEYLWVGISGLYVKNILDYSEFSPEIPCIYQKEGVELSSFLLAILEAQGSSVARELEMIGRTYLFLSQLMAQGKSYLTGQSEHHAQKAKEFIDRNYSSGVTPQQVAEKMNLSRSHLHRVFTSEFGLPVGKYIHQLQMERAALLLKTTELPIGAVSNSVGFENQLYFSKVFKGAYGMSPSQYRQQETMEGAG